MNAQLVSTIIPVHNRPELLRRAVDSVLAQTYRPIEIVIADDGSTDDTPAVLAGLASSFPGTIRLTSGPGRGPGPAREAARRLATGAYIQYLDSDDRLLPEKFAVQVDALRRNPECSIAYGRTRQVDLSGHVRVEALKWTGRRIDSLFPGLLVDRWWSTETPLYRRELCDRIGPWSDLRFSQDWEYDARAGSLKARLAWCDAPVSEHSDYQGPRQISSGWLDAPSRLRFLNQLHACAIQAGVTPEQPEMRHFSRWAFLNCRLCGAMGDAEAARQLWSLARAAQGRTSPDLLLYRLFAAAAGWRHAGRVAEAAYSALGRKPGVRTLAASWAHTPVEPQR